MSRVFLPFLKIFFGTRLISLTRNKNGAADLAAPIGYLDYAVTSTVPQCSRSLEVEPFADDGGEFYHYA